MTLGESWLLEVFLEKMIQLGWFGTPTNFSPSLFNELGINQINNHGGSWMKCCGNH